MGGLEAAIPAVILMLPVTWGVWWISPRIGANRLLWTVLMAIPFVNILLAPVFFFLVAGALLDRLERISQKLEK